MVRWWWALALATGCADLYGLDAPSLDEEVDGPGSGAGPGAGSGAGPGSGTLATCGINGVAYDKRCFERRDAASTWQQAYERCKQQGATLAKLDGAAAQPVGSALLSIGTLAHVGAWDPTNSGLYMWLDGTELVDPTWLPFEPDFEPNEHCIVLEHIGVEIGLSDKQCEATRPFICERLLD